MFKDNLVQLRKMKSMTQEDIAEKVGVSRQSVAKWESGESIPDLEKSRLLAKEMNVSLDELVNHETSDDMGFGVQSALTERTAPVLASIRYSNSPAADSKETS